MSEIHIIHTNLLLIQLISYLLQMQNMWKKTMKFLNIYIRDAMWFCLGKRMWHLLIILFSAEYFQSYYSQMFFVQNVSR